MSGFAVGRGFVAALIASAGYGIGLFLTLLLAAFFVIDSENLEAVRGAATVGVAAIWISAAIVGAAAGLVGARQAQTKVEGIVAGALGGAVGYVFVALLAMLGVQMIVTAGNIESTDLEAWQTGLWKTFAFALPAGATGAIAGMLTYPRGAAAAEPEPSYLPTATFAPPPPLPMPAAPSPSPAPTRRSFISPPSPPTPLPKGARGARRWIEGAKFQCPQCGTFVQPPPTRPVELVCPMCRFAARVG